MSVAAEKGTQANTLPNKLPKRAVAHEPEKALQPPGNEKQTPFHSEPHVAQEGKT